MKVPNASAQCVVAPKGNKDAGTKIESHVHAASVGDGDIMRKAKQATVDIEEGLPVSLDARGKV